MRSTRSIPKLYGKKYVRYNVHLLPHIVNVCIQCSCFSETVCDRGNVWDSSGKTMFLEKELKCSISLPVYDNPANHPYCIDVVFDVVWRYTSCQLMMAAKSSHNNIVTASRQCWQAACIVHRYWNNTETMSIINKRLIILFYVIDLTLKQCCLTTSTAIMDTAQWVSKETIQ